MHNVTVKINGQYKILPKLQVIGAFCTDNEAMTLPLATIKSFIEKISIGPDNILKLHCTSDLAAEIPEYHGTPRMFTVSPLLPASEIKELENSTVIIEHSQWGGIYQIIGIKKTNAAVGLLVKRIFPNIDNII